MLVLIHPTMLELQAINQDLVAPFPTNISTKHRKSVSASVNSRTQPNFGH